MQSDSHVPTCMLPATSRMTTSECSMSSQLHTRMFSGFRSLCDRPMLCNCWTPCKHEVGLWQGSHQLCIQAHELRHGAQYKLAVILQEMLLACTSTGPVTNKAVPQSSSSHLAWLQV